MLSLVSAAQAPTDAALRGRILAPGGDASAVTLQLHAADGAPAPRFHVARDGSFFLSHLDPGTYELRGSSAAGSCRLAITLEPGEITDITMELDPLHPRPACVGASPHLFQPAFPAAASSAAEPQDPLTALPVESRSYEALAELDPLAHDPTPAAPNDSGATDPEAQSDQLGAERASAEDNPPSAGLSTDGLPVTSNDARTDGLSAMQYFRQGPRGSAAGGPASQSHFAQGAVRSFRASPRDFSAEAGGSGADLSIATRRGASAWHGDAFAILQDGAWSATNPFSIVTHYNHGTVTSGYARPGGATETCGAAIGGPLRLRHPLGATPPPARATLFAAVEAQWKQDQITSTPSTAAFYQLTATQLALLANRGVASSQIVQALDFLDSLTGVLHRSAHRVQAFARVDLGSGVRNAFTAEGAIQVLAAPAGVALGQASDAVVARGLGSLGDRSLRVESGAGRWSHRFNRAMDNELSAQAAHELEYEQPRTPLAQEPATAPGGYAPEVRIAPEGFSYGTPANLGRVAYPDEFRIEARDTLQWRLRSHLLRMGAEWSRINDRLDALANADGTYNYESGTTGGYAGGLADWITDFTYNAYAYPNGGCPSIVASSHFFCFHTFSQSFGAQQTEFIVHQVAGFVQDSARLRDNLVVQAGVRYDYTLLPLPQSPNFALDASIATLARPDAGTTSSIPEDRNNFGPRLTVAWAPHFGRRRGSPWFTVLAGYGVFYGHTPGATVAAALTDTALPSTTLRVRIRPTTITQCPQITTISQGFGYPCDYTTLPPAAVAQTSSAIVLSSRFREPSIQRGSFALERDPGSHLWLRAEYSMAIATQLPESTDLNIAPSATTRTFVLQGGNGRIGVRDGETFVVPFYGARPVSTYGAITAVESHANATFHAGALAAGLRDWHGLTLRGSFAVSRAIDYGPQQGATPRRNSQFDPFANGYDKGLSILNFPERFAGSLVYRTGRESGSAWRNRLAAGWTASAIATAGSGAPYSYSIFGGTYLPGGGDSINGSGGAVYLPTVGRNTLRLPAHSRVDVRLAREFAVAGRVRLNAFAQAFNVANSISLSQVEMRAFLVGASAGLGLPTPLIFQDAPTVAAEGIETPAFGAPLSSTSGLSRERRVEAGLRVQF
jgi:hypothetical protein